MNNKEKRTELGEGCQLVETETEYAILTMTSSVILSKQVYLKMIAHSAPEVFRNPK